jgi:hypothetical protein
MTRLKLFGAAAILAASIATPVMAQEAVSEPAAYAQSHPYANVYYDGYGYGRSGFWPGDVAADVIGGAIGTADAIATAPFRDDSYTYYRGARPYGDTYAYYGDRPVVRRMTRCGVQPGATYLGPDGRWYPC